MPQANRILLLRTSDERFDRAPYVVRLLAEEWRKRGIRVDVTDRLTEATGPDVLVFPHFDVTITPRRHLDLLSRCARVINRAVTDISKRNISRHLVTSPNEYDGPVIVKTNRNYGGVPEAKAAAAQGALQRCMIKVMQRLPWTISGLLGREGYRVYGHPRLVPRVVWHNPLFVIEKFRPEMEGDLYCVRQYVFLGPCEINSRGLAPHPLVKSKNVIRREILESTPAAVREFRAQLGFDFGKFDYVMDGDEPIVFDVNHTPTYNPASKAGSPRSFIAKLAPGILPFLGKS